jgi:nucleotide-binding universal stress UspA family protein
MRSLLVPIDGSENSFRALDYAASHGKYGPVTLHLLHVGPPLDDYGMVGAHLSPQQHAKLMKERAHSILKRATGRVRSAQVECKTHIVIGNVATTVAAQSRRLKCESIVMGTRGMGGIANLLLGSVASKVVHLARVPVTLVK